MVLLKEPTEKLVGRVGTSFNRKQRNIMNARENAGADERHALLDHDV